MLMSNLASHLLVLWVWLTQSGAIAPLRTGDVARHLTEQDVAVLQRVLPSGAKPWLLNGDRLQIPDIQFIEAYLSPTTATPTLRRGTVVSVLRRITGFSEWPVRRWTQYRSESYAQVA